MANLTLTPFIKDENSQGHRITLFLDTEFTSFEKSELISLALVKNEDEHIYLESSSFNKKKCSDFVNNNVLPHMNSTPLSISEIKIKLNSWIKSLNADEVIILVDWNGDWDLLYPLLDYKTPIVGFLNIFDIFYDYCSQAKSPLTPEKIRKTFDEISSNFTTNVKNYIVDNNNKEHHALNDAVSNFKSFNEVLKLLAT